MISLYNKTYRPLSNASKIVLVGGCFDVLHYGHLTFLKKAKDLGNYLLIALESDEALVATKDRKVFHIQEQRAEILHSLSFVDEVLCLPRLTSDDDYMGLVQCIKPKIIALTQGDPQSQNKEIQSRVVEATCVSIPFEKGFSTTDLLKKYRPSSPL